jgi:flagellar operon protein
VSDLVPNPALVPPSPAGGPGAVPATSPARTPAAAPSRGPSFADVLAKRTAGGTPPQFSRHALERLQRRGIEMDQPTLDRLTGGISRAASKGSRDSVVFVDSTAFVVSVRNNTVVTAVGSEHMREHVFTNIDSAVIA